MSLAIRSTGLTRLGSQQTPCSLKPALRCSTLCFSKGFGAEAATKKEDAQAQNKPATESDVEALEALEARIRGRRAKQAAKAKVQVESAAVAAVTGKGPAPPTAQAETTYISVMLFLGCTSLLQGLIVAGSGFLPDEWDQFVQDVLYPTFTPTVFTLLALSTIYGLWKIGKLNLPFMGAAPPLPKDD